MLIGSRYLKFPVKLTFSIFFTVVCFSLYIRESTVFDKASSIYFPVKLTCIPVSSILFLLLQWSAIPITQWSDYSCEEEIPVPPRPRDRDPQTAGHLLHLQGQPLHRDWWFLDRQPPAGILRTALSCGESITTPLHLQGHLPWANHCLRRPWWA